MQWASGSGLQASGLNVSIDSTWHSRETEVRQSREFINRGDQIATTEGRIQPSPRANWPMPTTMDNTNWAERPSFARAPNVVSCAESKTTRQFPTQIPRSESRLPRSIRTALVAQAH